VPLATPNLTIRREIEKAITTHLSTLESKLSSVLNQTLSSSLNWVSRCLSQQKKTDYRPKEDVDLLTASSDTPACQAVCAFLTRVATQASGALTGRNLSLFLAELARGLRALILAHLLKFTFSQLGGITVSRDMTRYSELVRHWPTGDELEPDAMDVLVDVSQLFVLQGLYLRDKLQGRQGQDLVELKGFVARREDVGSVEVQAALMAV
jgi:hypothetical protein